MFGLGTPELIIIGIVAVLLFGSRLPEVARSLGKGMMEFKKGMQGLEHEVHTASRDAGTSSSSRSFHEIDDRDEATAPKFEPPTSEPQPESMSDSDSQTV